MLSAREMHLVDAVKGARRTEDIELECSRFREISTERSADAAELLQALAPAVHRFLSGLGAGPAFAAWVDTYFGRRPGAYRSRQQRPEYIYYPSLAPTPWFATDALPRLHALRAMIPVVAAELRDWLQGDRAFRPYVAPEASSDRVWRVLAANPAWSSIHLIKSGVADTALLDQLPALSEFLGCAPLPRLEPHAPECFISRLQPGVELPSHYGVSNIKLTAHLPIDIPETGCTLTVAGESRSWPLDEFLVFDDSFLHSAANRSQQPRTVLIFDVRHPALGDAEQAALAQAIRVLDAVNAAAHSPVRR